MKWITLPDDSIDHDELIRRDVELDEKIANIKAESERMRLEFQLAHLRALNRASNFEPDNKWTMRKMFGWLK